jgi:hypothetical protein
MVFLKSANSVVAFRRKVNELVAKKKLLFNIVDKLTSIANQSFIPNKGEFTLKNNLPFVRSNARNTEKCRFRITYLYVEA